MPYANDFFSATLSRRISETDNYLPVCEAARTDLLRFIPNGSYTYASLVDDSGMETVALRNEYGTIIMERGYGGTTAAAHPVGTCVRTVSPTIVEVIKDLVCNWKCCDE